MREASNTPTVCAPYCRVPTESTSLTTSINASVEIRLACPKDVPRLGELVKRYWEFEKVPGFKPAAIERLLQQLIAAPQLGMVLLSEVDGLINGYLIAVLLFSLEHQGLMGEIDELYISPGMRSRGMGAKLLAFAEQELARKGCVRMQLQIGKGNTIAREFYRFHGFVERAAYDLLDKPLAEN